MKPLLSVSLSLSLFLFCSTTIQQGAWKTITFMDCDNVTHSMELCLTTATYDSESGYLRVDGRVRNRMQKEWRFNLRNWVYRLDEHGTYLKARCTGLPVIQLKPVGRDGTAREETFSLLFKLEPNHIYSQIAVDYADLFYLTGKINKIIVSVPLNVRSGTVTSRG